MAELVAPHINLALHQAVAVAADRTLADLKTVAWARLVAFRLRTQQEMPGRFFNCCESKTVIVAAARRAAKTQRMGEPWQSSGLAVFYSAGKFPK